MILAALPHGCPGLSGYERLPGMFVHKSIVPVQPSTCLIAELRCSIQKENCAEALHYCYAIVNICTHLK